MKYDYEKVLDWLLNVMGNLENDGATPPMYRVGFFMYPPTYGNHHCDDDWTVTKWYLTPKDALALAYSAYQKKHKA